MDIVRKPTIEGLRHARNLAWKMLFKERQRVADLKNRLNESQDQCEWLELNAVYPLEEYADFIANQK